MDLNLGSVIKRLRIEHSVTQEELAAFFGVRIDELFSVNHEDELERIDTMLQRETMTDQNYSYAKRILDGILRNPGDVGAMKRYAKVYLAKTNTDLLAAGRMLEKAMELSPLDEEIYSLYRAVRGGSEYKYMREVLLGDISLAKGNEDAAKDIWSTVPKENWLGQYEVGERFNRLNEYERAIECFNNAYEAQTAPHKMDMMDSLAFYFLWEASFNPTFFTVPLFSLLHLVSSQVPLSKHNASMCFYFRNI